MVNCYIYNKLVNIHSDNEKLHMTNQETFSLLKNKTKTYLSSDDANFKYVLLFLNSYLRSNFFDVIFNYVEDIGLENSVNLFLHIINKIVY